MPTHVGSNLQTILTKPSSEVKGNGLLFDPLAHLTGMEQSYKVVDPSGGILDTSKRINDFELYRTQNVSSYQGRP